MAWQLQSEAFTLPTLAGLMATVVSGGGGDIQDALKAITDFSQKLLEDRLGRMTVEQEKNWKEERATIAADPLLSAAQRLVAARQPLAVGA